MNLLHKGRVALFASLATTGLLAGEATPPAPPAPVAPAVPAAPPAQSATQAQAQAQTERKLAEAQQRLEAAAREVSELSAQLGNHMGERRIVMRGVAPMRAQLGVQIDNTPSKDGAHVLAVSPGGPAAEAGIRNGDVIVSVAGEDLTKYGNPAQTLVERTRELQPDLKVKVSVLRAGKKMDFDVTPRPMPPMAGVMAFPGGGPGPRTFTLPAPPPGQEFEWRGMGSDMGPGTRFRGIEFATVSEKLGSYFGVKSGVLVVRTGGNDTFKLQDGDVILSIDGREPGNAQHAGRILRSYRGGEKLNLRVQRDRKAQNIEVTLPGGSSGDIENDD
jgi:S1-C subfamily serine protease